MKYHKVSSIYRRNQAISLLLVTAFLLPAALCRAEEVPLFEFGLGVGGLYQPYYPGSDETRSYLFPVPLPIYRGEVFKSDDEGMRAQLIRGGRYKLDMSLDFNLAVDSNDVALRAGMDDVDSMLQLGPSLEIELQEDDRNQWLLKLPVRANFGFSKDGINASGYTFAPNLTYHRKFSVAGTEWRSGIAIGPQFGSSEYQNVYYGVASEFATLTRPEYRADSGYSGSRTLMTLKSHNDKRLWVWFVRYDDINGASFADSPLVETNAGWSVGFIYSHYLYKSKQAVTR